MRKSLLGASALVSIALLANTAAEAAATYVPIAFPSGAVTVLPFGINDNNIIAGGYTDSGGVLHGFYGPPDGSNYTTFDVTGAQAEARGIRNDGSITGLALASGFTFGEEFYRSPDGSKLKLLKDPAGNIQDGVAQGGNDAGVYVGDYLDTDGVTRLGFEGKAGKFKSAFKLPIKHLTSTNPRQINNNGVVAGGYIGSDGIQHGFVLDGNNLTSFDAPGAVGVTTAEGINDAGQVSGLYQDSAGNRHAFAYNVSTGNFKAIDPGDGSTAQEAWGINNKGLIVFDTNSGAAPYIYCPLKPRKCPKGAAASVAHPGHVQALKGPINLP
jgi:probable HAF family extracellular repeat protein